MNTLFLQCFSHQSNLVNSERFDWLVWTHWIQVCVPDDVYQDSDLSILVIDGGPTPNIQSPFSSLDPVARRLCQESRLITSRLSSVPNQPIVFADDPAHETRREDAIIAWTWLHFVENTNEPDWLARYPMTKASIKAIDAIQEFMTERILFLGD